jgi:hypothetical protein
MTSVVGPPRTNVFAGYRSATDRIVRRLARSETASDAARAL